MRKLKLLGIALIGAALFSTAVRADPFDVLLSINWSNAPYNG